MFSDWSSQDPPVLCSVHLLSLTYTLSLSNPLPYPYPKLHIIRRNSGQAPVIAGCSHLCVILSPKLLVSLRALCSLRRLLSLPASGSLISSVFYCFKTHLYFIERWDIPLLFPCLLTQNSKPVLLCPGFGRATKGPDSTDSHPGSGMLARSNPSQMNPFPLSEGQLFSAAEVKATEL